jgi:hypothetical protein
MTEKRKRGRPPGSGKKQKSALDEAVSIPYERQISDDPNQQALNDLMEIGRCAIETKPDGIRRLDPLGPEVSVALYNAEHSGQTTEYDGGRDLSYLGDEAPQFQTHSPLEAMLEVLQDVEMVKKAQGKLQTTSPEPVYPANWDKMSKVEKLAWHTSNKH